MSSRLSYYADLLIVGALLLLTWQILHWALGAGALASPFNVCVALEETITHAGFWQHAVATLKALALAFGFSVFGGILLGVLLGLMLTAGDVMEPILVSFYALPKVILYPIILLTFGLGFSAKVAFGALHGLIPVCLLTMNAVRQIPDTYIRTARVLRLRSAQILFHIVGPAILPTVLSSLKLGFSLSLLGVLIGEMFAAKAGLGFLIMNAISNNDMPTLLALIVLLFAFAITVNWLLESLVNHLTGHHGRGVIEEQDA